MAGFCISYYIRSSPSRISDKYDLSRIHGVQTIPLPVDLRPAFFVKWSPSGEKIAIVAQKYGVFPGIPEVYVFNVITKDLARITNQGEIFIASHIP